MLSEAPKGYEGREVYLVGVKPVCYLVVGRCFIYHPRELQSTYRRYDVIRKSRSGYLLEETETQFTLLKGK